MMQADLRVEAKNLLKFYKNFEGLHEKVIWPKLIPDLVSEGVIVESFERGAPLYEFLRNRSALNTQVLYSWAVLQCSPRSWHILMYPIWNGRIFITSCDDDSSPFPNVLQCICTPEFNHLQQAFLIHSEEEHGFISEQKVGLCMSGCRLLQ
jgi:hypothetical protein